MAPNTSDALALSEDLIERVIALDSDDERALFFRTSPFLSTPQVAVRLARAVSQRSQIDIREADSLSRTALWLATEVGDQESQALALRARANCLHISGRNAEALEYYRSAAEQFADFGNALEEAITLSNGLGALMHLQFNQEAGIWAKKARATFQELGDELRLARLELNYANVQFRQDRWEDAAAGYEAAYSVLKRIGNPQDIAICLSNRAVCHKELNQVQDALRFYSEARRFAEQNDVKTLIPTIDYNISYLHFLSGRYTDAIEGFQRTREAFASIGDTYHESLCNLDLGTLYLEVNLLTEASNLLVMAYEGFDSSKMPFEKARSLTALSIAMHRVGRPFVAVELLKIAEEIFRDHENRFWAPLVRLCRSQILLSVGRHRESKALAADAAQGFQDVASPKHLAMSLLALGGACHAGSEHQAAQRYLTQVFELLGDRDDPQQRFQAYVLAGRVSEDQESDEEAIGHYRRAEKELGRLRNQIIVEDLSVPQFPRGREIYEDLVLLSLRTRRDRGGSNEIFEWIEEAKTRTTAALISARTPPTARSQGRSAQANSVQQLREELNWYYRQIDLQGMRTSGRSEADVRELEEISRSKEQHLVQTLRSIGVDGREYLSLSRPEISPQHLQTLLKSDEMLVHYFVARNVLLAAAITNRTFRIVPLTTLTHATECVERFRLQLLRSDFHGGTPTRRNSRKIRASLATLFDDLLAPLFAVERPSKLTIVPDRVLYYVPFHALFDGSKHLYESCQLHLTTRASVSALEDMEEAPVQTFVLGVPNERAPFIVDETKAALDSASNPKLFMGREANLGAIPSTSSSKRVVQISTVGTFRSDNPMFSTVELGGSPVNLFDLSASDMSADLLILSGSCAPALSPTDSGEQMLTLAEALRNSGANNAIAGLWKIDHPSSAVFWRNFHATLCEGAGLTRAFNKAISETRNETDDDIYCWASHALFRWPVRAADLDAPVQA